MFFLTPECQCDPTGSEHGGECESHTDQENDLVAGRCICKKYVEGERCDSCQDGFWNMREDNPDGCEGRNSSTIHYTYTCTCMFVCQGRTLLCI